MSGCQDPQPYEQEQYFFTSNSYNKRMRALGAIAPCFFVIRDCLMFALGISLSHGDGGFDRSEVEAFNLLSRKS